MATALGCGQTGASKADVDKLTKEVGPNYQLETVQEDKPDEQAKP
jgi:hypothetical protein